MYQNNTGNVVLFRRRKSYAGFSGSDEIKIVIVGSAGSGKTSLLHAVSETPVFGAEAAVSGRSTLAGKASTTVAMGYGQLHLYQSKLHLYGAPGQRRFSFMASVLCQGASGMLIMLDNHSDNILSELNYFLNFHSEFLARNPALIGISHCDCVPLQMEPMEVRRYCLVRGVNIPVMRIDAREKNQIVPALSRLVLDIYPYSECSNTYVF